MKVFKLVLVLSLLIVWISPAGGSSFAENSSVKRKLSADSKTDTARINTLTRTGFKYLCAKPVMYSKAEACIDTAVSICERKNIEIPALLSLLRAEFSFVTGDYIKASDYAVKAMKQAESNKEDEVLARSMVFLGEYYYTTGFFQEGLDYLNDAIAFSKKNGIKAIVPRSYYIQSSIYSSLMDRDQHRQSLQNLINEAIVESDTVYLISGCYLLGTNYADTLKSSKNFRLADSLLKQAYKIAVIKKDTVHIAASLANMGWNFYGETMFDSSLYYYNKSLEYSIPGKVYFASANAYGNLGTIYRDQGYTDRSVSYYAKAIEIAEKARDWYSLEWIYLDLTNIYLKLNDTSKAYNNYVLYKQFSDSMMIRSNTKGLSDARLRYETDSHIKEVELLSLRIENQKLMIWGFTGLIILTLAIGLLLFRGSKLKAKRRISEMNRKISEVTQANLRQQMNPHFIFNTLNSIQYYMYQHDKLATNNYLTKFSSLMRKVLENSQHTSVALHDELDALNLYLELERIRFKDKFDYRIDVDEEIDTLLYKVPTMLIQPYVENSICHGLIPAENKGFIKVDLKLNTDYIKCTIEDNGIGREAAQKRKVKSDKNHNSLGTQIVSSRLDLVNALYGTSLKTNYTDMKNDNGEPVGTRVEIHIPIIA
jgi:two-component system LytT family sensor kinase